MRKNKTPTRQIDYAKGIAALKMLILLTVELQIRQDKESDLNQAIEILKEAGYIKDESF